MAQIFNPWATPPTEGTLTGDLASFEINGMEGPEQETEAPEAAEPDAMVKAMQVISQQSELISKLMATLSNFQSPSAAATAQQSEQSQQSAE